MYPGPLQELLVQRTTKKPHKKQREPSSRPPLSLSPLLPHPSKVQAPDSFHPFPTLFVSSTAAYTGLGTGGEHGRRRPPHALLSLQEVPNRQYKLQVQEQSLAARAHTAALTSLSLDQSSWDYMCPPPHSIPLLTALLPHLSWCKV